MRYAEAIAWAYSLQPRGIRLELERMKAALALVGDPHRGLRVVHVAGTNGKGSTSATLERVLRAAGLRTGLYTSPHLHTFGERIRIDGKALGRSEITKRLSAVRELLGRDGAPMLTFFEVATLVAFQTFAERSCDVVVLEVGLGGRFDATNVVDTPLATAITSIAMDHEIYLGTTIEAIAGEKVGIAKPGVPLVVGTRDPVALGVIEKHAGDVGAPLLRIDREVEVGATSAGLRVTTPDGAIDRLHPVLEGAHQASNVAVAVATLLSLRARGLTIPDAAIRAGVRLVRWPGRVERIERPSAPAVLLDAAHNPEGAQALAAHLATLPRTGPRVLVFGAMRDKSWRVMLEALRPEIDRAVYFAPALERAEDARTLFAGSPVPAEVAPDHVTALALADGWADPGGLVVVCGSIFVLAPIRAALLGLDTDPPIAM